MSAYNKNDMRLLEEAYSLRLLKEQAPNMSLGDIKNRLSVMNETELVYITTVTNRILNEFWGQKTLQNVGAGLKNVGGAAANAVGGTAKSVGQRVKNTVGAAGQVAKNVAGGVGAAAGQVAKNVGDMYAAGKQSSQQSQVLVDAQQAIDQLTEYLKQAEASQLLPVRRGQVMNMTLNKIIQALQTAQETAGQKAQTAQARGFTGGAGQAFKQRVAGQA